MSICVGKRAVSSTEDKQATETDLLVCRVDLDEAAAHALFLPVSSMHSTGGRGGLCVERSQCDAPIVRGVVVCVVKSSLTSRRRRRVCVVCPRSHVRRVSFPLPSSFPLPRSAPIGPPTDFSDEAPPMQPEPLAIDASGPPSVADVGHPTPNGPSNRCHSPRPTAAARSGVIFWCKISPENHVLFGLTNRSTIPS